MARPYVDIGSKNEINQLLEHLEGMLPKFKSLSYVEWGLSRGFADHLSEVDITFYLDSEM